MDFRKLDLVWPRFDWLRRLLCRLLCLPCSAKVLVIRHADYDGATPADPNPPLNALGAARAQELIHVLEHTGISAIFTSEFNRTQETAAPIATAIGVTPTMISAADAGGLVDAVRGAAASGAVLVVGHSDTAPALLAALGAGLVAPIQGGEFDRLFVVEHKRTVELSYGSAT